MGAVTLDADVLIAFFDGDDDQHERAVRELRPRLIARERVVISASTYAEVLVRPIREGREAEVEEFLDGIGAELVAVDRHIGRTAAALRARHRSLRLPDALTLATALETDAELLTFDRRLTRVAREAR